MLAARLKTSENSFLCNGRALAVPLSFVVCCLQSWRRGDAGLAWSAAWTEYSLYFLFAFHSGLHDAFHVSVLDSKQHILQDTAVWDATGYEKWDACNDTFQLGRGYLSLVQSNIGINPQRLWHQLSACMGSGSAASSVNASQLDVLGQSEAGSSTDVTSADSRAAFSKAQMEQEGDQQMTAGPQLFTPQQTLMADEAASKDTAGLKIGAADLASAEMVENHNGAQVGERHDMAETAGHQLGRSQRALIADHTTDLEAALPENASRNLAQALLAKDHNGASVPGDTRPPLLLMRTKLNLRAAAHR